MKRLILVAALLLLMLPACFAGVLLHDAFDAGQAPAGWTNAEGASVATFGHAGRSLKITSYQGKQADTAWYSPKFAVGGKPVRVSCWMADNYMWLGGGGRDESFLATVELEWFDKNGQSLGLTWYLLHSDYHPIAEEDGPFIEPDGLTWAFKQAVIQPVPGAAQARVVFHFPQDKDPVGNVFMDDLTVEDGDFQVAKQTTTTAATKWPDNMLVNTPAPFNIFTVKNPLQFDVAFWGKTDAGQAPRKANIPAGATLRWNVTDFLEEVILDGELPLAGALKPYADYNNGQCETATVILPDTLKTRLGQELFFQAQLVEGGKVIAVDACTFIVTDPKPATTLAQLRNEHLECNNWGSAAPWGGLVPWGNPQEPKGINERLGISVAYFPEWSVGRWQDPNQDPAVLMKDSFPNYKGVRVGHLYAQDYATGGSASKDNNFLGYPQWMLKPWNGEDAGLDLVGKHKVRQIDFDAYARWVQAYAKSIDKQLPLLSVDPAGSERDYDDFSRRMQETSYKLLKAIRPDLEVSLSFYGGFFSDAGFEKYLKKNAFDYCDILDDHIYTDPDSLPLERIDTIYNRLEKLGKPKKFITTEMAGIGNLSHEAKATAQIRMVTDLMAHHFTFFNCFYTGEMNPSSSTPSLRNYPRTGDQNEQYLFFDPLSGPKISPALNTVINYREMPVLRLTAFYNLQRLLGWADFRAQVAADPATRAYVFDMDGKTTLVGYRMPMGGDQWFLLKAQGAKQVTLTDIFGREKTVTMDGDRGLVLVLHEQPAFWTFDTKVGAIELTPLEGKCQPRNPMARGATLPIELSLAQCPANWGDVQAGVELGRPYKSLAFKAVRGDQGKPFSAGWDLPVPADAPERVGPFIEVKQGDTCLALIDEQWKLAPPVTFRVDTTPVIQGKPATIMVTAKNQAITPWVGQVQVANHFFTRADALPEAFTADFTLAPGKEATKTFIIPDSDAMNISHTYPTTVEVQANGLSLRRWQQDLSFIACRKRQAPIVIDGDLSDWDLKSLKPVEFQRSIYFSSDRKNYNPAVPQQQAMVWAGPQDLQVKMYTRWDEQNLYIAYDVVDNSFVPGDPIWNGDTVMEDLLCGTINPGEGSRLTPIRSHLGKDPNGKDIAMRCDLGSPGLDNPPGVQFTMTVNGTHQVYEIAYPFDTLKPLRPGLGVKFRMSGWAMDRDKLPDGAITTIRGLSLSSYATNMDRNPNFWADWTMSE